MIVLMTEEYQRWFLKENRKSATQIRLRLKNIQEHNYFSDMKSLGSSLFELRWKNGRRIYFVFISEDQLLLLIGGIKNGQKKDIKQARAILKRELTCS